MHENMKLALGIRIENMDWEMCENTKKIHYKQHI